MVKLLKAIKEIHNRQVELQNNLSLDARCKYIDLKEEMHILQQAQKIINKYDIDTKKDNQLLSAQKACDNHRNSNA